MITLKKAKEIIEECFDEDRDFCKVKNYRIFTKKENTVAVTVNILSLDVLFSIMEHDLIENVYFHASASPPKTHLGPSDFRFKVYIQFNVQVSPDV